MRFWIQNFYAGARQPSLHLSLQDAGSIGAPAGGGEAAPSAPAPSAAPPAPTPSAPAPSSAPGGDPLAGYQYTSLGDLAQQLADGAQPEQQPTDPAQTLTATPDAQPAADGAPTGEPVPVPGIGEAPPVAPAPVQQFEALKGQLETSQAAVTAKEQELAAAQGKIAQFEAYAPAVEVMRANPGMVELVNMLQPVVSAGLTGFDDPRASDIGAAFIRALDGYDQRVSSALINGTLTYYGKDIAAKALERMGIAEADIPDYQRWKTSGGAASPAFTLDKFPEPDADGMALIPITDPSTKAVSYEQVDINDKAGEYKYNNEKFKFDVTQENKQRDAAARTSEQERATQQRAAQEQQAAREQQGRVVDWLGERGQAETAAYEKLAPEFTGEFERFATAASVMAHEEMYRDERYQTLFKEGKGAAGGGEGRRVAIGAEVDRISAEHVAAAVTFYSDLAKEITELRALTQEGKPKLPDDAPRVGAETQLTRPASAAPAPRPAAPAAPEGKFELLPGEDYATGWRRYNGGSLGSRMVAQVNQR